MKNVDIPVVAHNQASWVQAKNSVHLTFLWVLALVLLTFQFSKFCNAVFMPASHV